MGGSSLVFGLIIYALVVNKGEAIENSTRIVNSEYIVVLKPSVAQPDPDAALTDVIDFAKAQDPQADIFHDYVIFDFVGFALNTTNSTISAIRGHSSVQEVYPNRYIMGDLTAGLSQSLGDLSTDLWGLARISQRDKLDLTKKLTYDYDKIAGKGVHVYVIDSVVDIRHPEFENRAKFGYNSVDELTEFPVSLLSDPRQTHGTHVAGTIAAKTYGVAKNSTIVSVKSDTLMFIPQMNGYQYVFQDDDLIEALDWIEENHAARKAKDKKAKSVINMSLGGPVGNRPQALVEKVILRLIRDAQIPVVVAAGNSRADACYFKPARVADSITVGCSDFNDNLCGFSNYGTCVDIVAPGYEILSTLPNNRRGRKNGTSMSAPHVTGVVARYVALLDTPPSPDHIKKWLILRSTKNAVNLPSRAQRTPNRLLYMSSNPDVSNASSGAEWIEAKFTIFMPFALIFGSLAFRRIA